MLGAALPPRPPGGAPPKELPPAGQRRLPDGRRPDHLWSVLHRREESQGPRHRAESREEGGRRESRSLPSRPEMEMEPMQYPGQLPPLGWAPSPMPAMAMPNLAPENDWRDFKANHRPRMVVDGGAEAKEWLERRLDSALTEQRAELTRRFAGFEQSDKHFKDWVQREHEQLHSQLQQLRVSLQETASQQQRLVGNLTAQGQKQDMRLQELEGQMAQAAAQLQGLMNAVSAGALQGAGGNGGGTGEAAMGAAAVAASASANLEVLRAGLEREAQQRVQLGAETAEQLKQLSDMVYELNSRQQQQQSSQQQQLQQNAVQEEKDLVRSEARFAALEPSVLQLREELEEMRKMLYKCGADCAKRCDENEEICNKRLGGVQEAALSAARELWEEHQGVVVECKSSLSALQQILDSKDKIALQLRSLQQQQREEDKQEFWSQMQLRHEQLQAKLADTERALQTEQNTRIEEQQRYETVLSRLGLALEKAQAAWLRDSAKLSQEIHEAKRDFSIEMDGETRGVARRLADGLEAQQKLADELERKLALAKTELGSVLERLDSTARAQQQELRDAEGRLMRQVNDVQTIQGGRTQQAVFDMKAELAKQEQVSAARLSALQKGQDELEGRAMMALNNLETRTLQKIQDSADLEREKTRNEMTRALEEERTERLRMDEELREEHLRHLAEMREQVDDNKKELNEIVQNAEERLVKRLEDQVTVERTKTREQIEAFIEEERSERLKAEAERLTSLQKRLQAHEELTLQRLSEQRARWETEVETLRQKLEAQALKDKQDLNKDLQDFVQEERQVTSGLADDMRVLGGECQSLAESVQKHQSATEQRLAHEAAALSAQLSVGNASLTALLAQHGQTQQLALETRAREITGEIVKVSDELDKMNGEILKLIDDESDKVKEKHLAMESRVGTLEMAFTARTAALGEQDQVLQERMEELARQNGEAIENMRETLTSETGKLLEHMGRVQDDVKSVEAETLRRCEDMAEAQSEAKMEMDNMFGTFQANLGELGAKIEDVAISQSKIHTELKEQLQKLTESQEKVMLWLQHGLLPVLWNQVGRDTAVDVDKMFDASADSILATRTTPGIFMNWMQIVGGVRLRQRRLQKGECSLDPRLQERFSPSCYTEFLQVSPFGPGIGSYAEGFVPEDVMGAFDVRYSLGTPFREILENFQYMLKEHNWVGEASQSLQIQAAMVHGEATPPFFVMFEVRFDFKRSGYVAKELNIFLTATDMFPTTLEVVLHVLWALILFSLLFTQSFKTMSTYLSTRKKQLFAVDVRFVSDWIVIVFSIFIVGFFILIQQSIWDLAALVQEMPEYSPSASASEMETHERSWTLILDRVDEAAFFFDYFRVALFWYTLVIATQFSKIFAGQPKLAQLMSAFTHASEDLLHFCLLFLVLFLSFAIGGFMIWGMIMEEWSTPGKAVNSTLRALMGEVKLEEMYSYAPFGTLVWYGSFFVSIVVITLNLLVAMVYDHYTIIKGRAGSVAGVVEQLYWVSQDMSARLKGKSLWVKLTCCLRRHERIPMHRDLLEVCMEKAKLPNFERKAISSSVLGAKWTKKERERQLFSGQDVPETDEQMPVLPDFDEVDVDPDYADSLAAHAKEYAEAGYDPEDARVSQLRQLVAAAEDEIIDMRLRLQSCAEYTRQSMHGLTRRVDSLEQLVHSTLAELVTIANEAGVPTGGKARKGAQSQAPTSPGATGVQMALTGLGGSRQESKQEIDMVKKWHKASRAVNVRAARAEPPPNAKFFGPR